MERVDVDDLEHRMGPAAIKGPLSDALGAEHVAINYFELDPDDSLAFGYHRHEGQEEVFLVQSGTVTFETEDGDHVAEAGEVVRFAPGEWQQGVNEGDERAVVLAIGAPQEMGETDIRRECEDCGERTPQTIGMTDERDALYTECENCGARTGRFE